MTPRCRALMIPALGFLVFAGAESLKSNAGADLAPGLLAGGELGAGVDYWATRGVAKEYGAKIALGDNANAVLSLDLIADGGAGNLRDDGVTTGAVAGRGTRIAIEVFATGVTTSLRGVIIRFDFDASILSFVKAENSAFPLSIQEGSVGVNLAATSPVILARSGFLARAEFETIVDVMGREFSIGIESATLGESPTSSDVLSTSREITFNSAASPDFDGDGTVGFTDFLLFAEHFGTHRGDGRYQAQIDLDGDGAIGFTDFLIFAEAFGSRIPPSGGRGTPAGFAPADQNAFDRLAVGKRILGETLFLDIASAGRFAEGYRRHEGRYTYTNTGPNTGKLTQIYDDSALFGGRCTTEMTFTSATTGTMRYTCDNGGVGEVEAWRTTDLSAPVFVVASSDTLHFAILDTWRAGQTRAYDAQLRKKAPQGEWDGVCNTFRNPSNNTVTGYALWSFSSSRFESGTAYEMRYRYRNSSSCDTGSPDPWSPIAEGTTPGGGTGGGGTTPPSGNPDLIVESPLVDDNTLTTGQSFTLSATVRNQGNASAVSTTLRYYRSTNATITTSDSEVGTDAVSNLLAGATSAESIGLTAPASVGTYYYGACVDAVSGESDTGNNCSPAVTVTVGAAAAPDLVVDAPTVSTSRPAPGASFTLNATVRNQGNGQSAPTALRYYLSTDVTVSTSDTQVGTDAVSALAASGTSAESIGLTAPSSAGTYYYGACVESVSDETDTGNNCSPAVTVTVVAPDLVVDAPTVSTSRPTAGASFTLSATVRNQGNGRSSSTTLRYYRSTDVTVSTGDTEVGTDVVGMLPTSGTSVESISLRAPASAGTYYYGACVDDVSDESDTGNNCSPAVTVAVGAAPAPDLVVDAPTVSNGSPAAGASFTLSAAVRNQGNGQSAATTLHYYRSADATITTQDTQVGTDAVGGLAASRTSAESISLNAPSSAGTYYYGACVDAVSGESDIGNNCSRAVTVTVGIPDLVVVTVQSTNSRPTAGTSFHLSAGIDNQGTGPSAATTLRFYRSTDATISASDTEVGSHAVPSLRHNTGGLYTVTGIPVTAPSSAGTYYYGACVDAVTGESDTGNNCSAAVSITVESVTPPTGVSKLYWTDWGTDKIQRADLDGSNVEDLISGAGLNGPDGLSLDPAGGKMYWADSGTNKIQRANLDGSGVEDLLTDQNFPIGLALDVSGGKMYWTNRYPGTIQRANLDGSNAEELVTTGFTSPGALALDVAGGKMYWTSIVLGGQNKIQRADLNGSNVEDLVTTGVSIPYGLALDVTGGKIYWTDRGTDKIQRADLNGSNVEDLVTTGLSNPAGIALDIAGGKIYWTDAETDKVQRANLDGTGVEDLLTSSDGLVDPSSIAVGAEAASGSN